LSKPKIAIIHNIVTHYRHPLYEKLAEKMNITVYYCSERKKGRQWDMWPRKYNYNYEILGGFTIFNLFLNPTIILKIIENKPDAVMLSGYENFTMQITLILCRIMKIPIILFTEGILRPKTIQELFLYPIRTLFYKQASSFVIPGKMTKKYMLNHKITTELLHIAPNIIDNDIFIKHLKYYEEDKEKIKKSYKIDNKTVFLYIGKLIKMKGIDYLLKAYKRLKIDNDKIALIIVGYGSDKNKYKKMCISENIKDVIFIEPITSMKELVKYYTISDIFVFPTLTDLWGFVVNEAMICGLPVISTYESQAAREMIQNGINGYIIPPKDPEKLYEKMKILTENKELRKRMHYNAIKTIKDDFNIEKMLAGNMKAIQQAISK